MLHSNSGWIRQPGKSIRKTWLALPLPSLPLRHGL
jgi:hypothetical protein